MHTDDNLPIVSLDATLVDAIAEMSLKRLGMVGVIDSEGLLVGMFTDGDLRRTLSQNINVHESYIQAVMTSSPHNISENILAVEALEMMQLHSINGLFVVDCSGRPIGALNALDLIRARIL
jgi:arabinose-5-phosphate isomerase